ncbi:MAG: protein kinase [Pseudomonadota bacterium]|nr:protein kinase [Pseudomonadota bacterium]
MLPSLPERYRPTRQLGEGATGVVYHAEDRLLETEVAVKVVKTNLALHRRFRARFAREVAISARIVHPHVIPVFDTGALATGEPFVALGYAAGGSLADLLKLRPAIGEVLRLLDEVLDALAAIHARSLIHQDLKPGNILLYPGTDGQVHAWVADLGVADALAELTRDRKGISGTPGYMAPEQLLGRTQDLGPWTDLYAVGLILHETLSGERPHPGEGRQDLLEARLRAPPLLGTTVEVPIPAALSDLVASLLDPEPRQRMDRAADVRRALRDAVKGQSFRGRVRSFRGDAFTSATTGPMLGPGEYPLNVPPPPDDPHRGALRWNRVQPDPIPSTPPVETGWEAPARASLPLFALREVPLVGRERERQVLWDAAREVIALGTPRLVLIVGESGSGKTRLVSAVANAFEEGGWMEVTQLQYHSPPGVDDGFRGAVRDLLVPWNDTREGMEARLGRWIGRDRQAPPREVAEEASILTRWCGYLKEGEPPVSDAVGLAYLYRYLDARAWRGGSCLVLEDAHHALADGDGLAIAEALLDRTVGERPVLVLCTLSAEALARDPALRRKVEGLQERGARRIGLRRLNLTETRRVVQESLQLHPELARVVSLECEGDPLAAGLLLREWAARKLLVPGVGGLYTLSPDITLAEAIPRDRNALLRRRLQAAVDSAADPAAAEEALAAAALAGQEPPAALIRAVNDAGLDALLATGLVAERRGSLVFEQSRLQQVALEVAGRAPNVKELHRRLAEAWETFGGSTDLDVDLPLGMHRLRSGSPEKALGPLLSAARKMIQGGRARDAIRAGAMAIEAADAVGQPTARLEARRLHAEALLETGEPERAVPLIEHALREVEGDRLARARLRVLLGRAARKRGDVESAQREFDAAHQTFTALRDRAGLVEVAVQRAKLTRMAGLANQSITHWAEVVRMNRGDLALEAEALNGLVEALIRAGRLEQIDRQVARLQRVSRASGDTRRIAEASATWGMLHLERQNYDEAQRLFSTAGAIAATLGSDQLHLRCRSLLSEVARQRGDLDAAEEINRWLARFCEERALFQGAAAARVQLALLALARGELRRVRTAVEAAAEDLSQSPQHGVWMYIGVIRAVLAAEDGDERTCRAWWAVARERGVGERHAPDLWPPLERLAGASDRHGWADIAKRARATVATESTTAGVVIDEV